MLLITPLSWVAKVRVYASLRSSILHFTSYKRGFARNSNSTEMSFSWYSSHQNSNRLIATQICSRHDGFEGNIVPTVGIAKLLRGWRRQKHYYDVIMTTMASEIISLTVVYSTVYLDADQRKHQSSASLAFVWGIHRYRWIPRTKGQLRGKCFHLMTSSWEEIRVTIAVALLYFLVQLPLSNTVSQDRYLIVSLLWMHAISGWTSCYPLAWNCK